MRNRTIRAAFALAAVCWAVLIFYLSSQASIEAPALFPGQDKLFHLLVFAVLGFLLMGSLLSASRGYTRRQLGWVALAVMLYGVSDEFHQYFVPGRSAEVYDALADALGGLLGAWVMYRLSRFTAKQHA